MDGPRITNDEFKITIASKRRFFSPAFVIVALVTFAALGNFVGSLLFWQIDWTGTPFFVETAMSFALGLLIAQPCLLSIWCVLARQPVVVRVPVSLGILFLLTCFYVLTFRLLDTATMSGELLIVFLAIPFSIFSAICVPLWFLHWKNGLALGLGGQSEDKIESRQFGIRHLFILTTATAIMIPIAQRTFGGAYIGTGNGPWFELVSFIALYMMLAWLISLISIALVFKRETRFQMGAAMAIAVFLCPLFVAVFLAFSFPIIFSWKLDNAVYSVAFALALAIGICSVLGIFYRLGYRLQRG